MITKKKKFYMIGNSAVVLIKTLQQKYSGILYYFKSCTKRLFEKNDRQGIGQNDCLLGGRLLSDHDGDPRHLGQHRHLLGPQEIGTSKEQCF